MEVKFNVRTEFVGHAGLDERGAEAARDGRDDEGAAGF